jgi:FkbM family methyltransferase
MPPTIALRPGTSDAYVYHQVVTHRGFACLDDLPEVGLVIDAGANIGLASAHFLDAFPDCHVVAIEPCGDNFALMRHNLAHYGDRVTTLQAGLWSHSTGLVVRTEPYRDGREWARQVRECEPGEPSEMAGIDVASILALSGFDRVSLLKIDIEGAEAVVFAGDCDWLDSVDAIAIELHDDSIFGNASRPFFAAIAGRGFSVTTSGELTICRR